MTPQLFVPIVLLSPRSRLVHSGCLLGIYLPPSVVQNIMVKLFLLTTRKWMNQVNPALDLGSSCENAKEHVRRIFSSNLFFHYLFPAFFCSGDVRHFRAHACTSTAQVLYRRLLASYYGTVDGNATCHNSFNSNDETQILLGSSTSQIYNDGILHSSELSSSRLRV